MDRGGTLRSVLLIKAFTFRLGSGILFDLDCVKSISDNQREVLAFGGFLLMLGTGARKSAPFFELPAFLVTVVSVRECSGATGSSRDCKIAS